MAKKKAKDTPSRLPDFLAYLFADDALAVLQILARDETLAARIREVVETYLKGNAPHSLADVEAVADEIRMQLEDLQVEEVWDRAGPSRHGYVDTRVTPPRLDRLYA